MAIIALSGKSQSGKDTVGKIIQFLMAYKKHLGIPKDGESFIETMLRETALYSHWQTKQFAGKLKEIVCLLIGCTMEQLEDNDFKETPLGEEWISYAYADGFTKDNKGNTTMLSVKCDKEMYEIQKRINWQTAYKFEHTPRTLLQYLGTNCGREIIHKDIWVNALMSDYKGVPATILHDDCPVNKTGVKGQFEITEDAEAAHSHVDLLYPNWIITDVRFPNEVEAIKNKKGIVIRVNRPLPYPKTIHIARTALDVREVPFDKTNSKHLDLHRGEEIKLQSTHESETALDDYQEFDEVINNDGTIEELIEKVKTILVKHKIL